MNVLIVCANGMTSSALCQKVRDKIKQENMEDIKVGSCGISEITKYAPLSDLILLAPQIAYSKEKLDALSYTKYKVLPMDVYTNNTENVILDMILDREVKAIKKSSIFTKIKSCISKITTNDYVLSVYNGMYATFTITVIGSIFSLLQSFPLPIWQSFLKDNLLQTFFSWGYNMTIGMYAFYLCIFTSKCIAEVKKQNVQGVIISSIVSFFLITNAVHDSILDVTYFDVKGLFVALFIAICISRLYQCVMQIVQHFMHIEDIRMSVRQSMISLIPVSICVTLSITFTFLFQSITHMSFPAFVYSFLETHISPVIGNNQYSNLIASFLATSLWFFGIHGGKVVGTITDPLFKMYSLSNLQAWHAGKALPYIVTASTSYMYLFGGAGSTLALCILMVLFSKSQKYKNLGKISLPMGIFFINEPILFGIPYVLNPLMLFPFLIIPFISGFLTVTLMNIHFLPRCIGFDTPWTTPPIISGFIQGGWKLALWQIFILLLQLLLWYPFFHYLDKKEYEKESH